MSKPYQVIEIVDKKAAKAFLKLPVSLYKNDSNWIRPLDKDIEKVFDPEKNKFFRHGKAIRWILKDSDNNVVGRIAAFFDKRQAFKQDQPTGGIGFFECINDKEAAFTLFDTAKEWLTLNGMEAMDGPVNFGERHQWWGLLVDGFFPPNYATNYNFSYYREFFESYGFKLYFKQFTYNRTTDHDLVDIIKEKASKILSNPQYKVEHYNGKDFNKLISESNEIYNKAWVNHTGVNRMTEKQARLLFQKLKSILDKRLLWFTYFENKPVAFFLMIPELNQIFKYVNGKMNLLGKLKFFYHMKTKSCSKALGFLFGVIPEHQGKGVDAAMMVAFSKIALDEKFQYTEIEMNWIGDFNPKMVHVVEQLGASVKKTHHTYRYLFDRTKPFNRAPMMD